MGRTLLAAVLLVALRHEANAEPLTAVEVSVGYNVDEWHSVDLTLRKNGCYVFVEESTPDGSQRNTRTCKSCLKGVSAWFREVDKTAAGLTTVPEAESTWQWPKSWGTRTWMVLVRGKQKQVPADEAGVKVLAEKADGIVERVRKHATSKPKSCRTKVKP